MRKIVIFCFLFFMLSYPVHSRMTLPMLFGTSGIVCDDCSGATQFAWHMEDNDATPDVTIGNPCGCSDGDTIGAQTGSPAFSGAQKSDGSYSLHINDAPEYYTFDVSADDIVNMDDIKITFDIYIVSYPAADASSIIRIIESGSVDLIDIILEQTAGEIQVWRVVDDGETQEVSLGVAVSTGSMVSCEYQGKTGIGGNDHYLICGATSDEQDHDLSATQSADVLIYGENFGEQACEYYLDNVKITASDRY